MKRAATPAKAAGMVRGALQLLHLRAAATCTGQKDVRYYLNGVLIELHASAVIIVATDGHRLFVARDRAESPAFDGCVGPTRMFLENDQIAQVLSTFKRSPLPRVSFALDPDKNMVEFSGPANLRIACSANAETAASFPSWRRIFSREKPSGKPAQFDPRYLCACANLATMLNGRRGPPAMRIDHNGDSAALVTFGNEHEIALVLMPYRTTYEPTLDWIDAEKPGEGW